MKKEISRPGFIKRLIVVIYDGFLLAGLVFTVLLVAGVILLLLKNMVGDSPAIKLIAFCLLALIAMLFCLFFYTWFWTKGGQTLGMRAWNLYLVDQNGKFIDRKTAAIRFFVALVSWACAGLGFAWILLNRKKLAWHDIATKTQIVRYIAPPHNNNSSTRSKGSR